MNTALVSPVVGAGPGFDIGAEPEAMLEVRIEREDIPALAECIKKVRNVYFLEQFGSPEAIWELDVVDFPAVVTIDAHGSSLHEDVLAKSREELAKRVRAF